MSYDLAFWRQTPDLDLEPDEVLRDLLDDEEVEGLVTLDVDAFLSDVLAHFRGAVREADETLVWDVDGEPGSFELTWSDQHVHAHCQGELPQQRLDALADIAREHGCAQYDPQTDERTAQPI